MTATQRQQAAQQAGQRRHEGSFGRLYGSCLPAFMSAYISGNTKNLTLGQADGCADQPWTEENKEVPTCGFHMCRTGTFTAAAAAATRLSCVNAAQRTPSAAAAEGPNAVQNTTTAKTTTNTTAALDMLAMREGSRTTRLTGRAPSRVTPVM